MTRQTIDREAWRAMLAKLDADIADALELELLQWTNGGHCTHIEVTLDSLGRVDSRSSPCPAEN